jgi:putative ABC transport system ATP-binding protein
VIRLRDVHKAYADGEGRVEVLRGVSAELTAGDFVAVVGPSGAGKSTLLHLLGGLDRNFIGTVEAFGVDLRGLSDRALARYRGERVGFVFQSFNLVPPLTVLENVLLPSYFGGGDVAADRSRAREVLARVGLAGKEDRLPAKLSGGERQRVAIARALLRRPPLLLADEPTGSLDAGTGGEVIELFRELNRQEGITLVIVTHEARVAAAARRVLRLAGGRLEEVAPGAAAAVGREVLAP